MHEVEHVLYDHKNPEHKKHLRFLSDERSREIARDNLNQRWAREKEHQAVPLEDFVDKWLDTETRSIRMSDADLDLPVNEKLVIQLLDGKPVGYTKYLHHFKSFGSEEERPFINAMFLLPSMRDTLVEENPVSDEKGKVHFELKKEKRGQLHLLAKRMIEFIRQTEGAEPVTFPISPQGRRVVEKFFRKKQ